MWLLPKTVSCIWSKFGQISTLKIESGVYMSILRGENGEGGKHIFCPLPKYPPLVWPEFPPWWKFSKILKYLVNKNSMKLCFSIQNFIFYKIWAFYIIFPPHFYKLSGLPPSPLTYLRRGFLTAAVLSRKSRSILRFPNRSCLLSLW